jgi:hypothetical protein
MFGTLAGALSGRKIPFDRNQFTAVAYGRIVGFGRTIKIESIKLHYDLTADPAYREAIERALRLHPEGCPAHQSVKGAIAVTWEATLRLGEDVVQVEEAIVSR